MTSCALSISSIILAKKLLNVKKDHDLWILSIAVNTLVIFTFLALLQLYLEKEKSGQLDWNKNFKRNAFLLILVTTKTIFWIGIITILTSEKQNNLWLFGLSGVILLICVTLVHFVHTIMTKGLYKKFFVEKKIEKSKDGKACQEIKSSWSKKIQYTFCILLACILFAIPMMLTRLAVSYLPELPININIPLFGKEIAFLNGHHGMLFICIIDCLCLIFGFLFIGKLSDYLFTEWNKKFDKTLENEAKKQFTEKIIKNVDFDLIKEMFKDFTLNYVKYNEIYKIIDQKGKNTSAGLTILNHYYFDKEKRNKLKNELNNLEKEIDKIRDKNKKKIAKIAILKFRKDFYIVTQRDHFKSNLFKASVSVASTLCLHFLTHIHQSGAQFNWNEWRAILVLALISSIFLSIGLIFDMIAGDVLIGKDGLFKTDAKHLKNLKQNKDLWKKVVEWKEESQKHKQRCGCESGGMKNEKNKQVKKYQILNNKFGNDTRLDISLEELKKINNSEGKNIFNTLTDTEINILQNAEIKITLNKDQIEEMLTQRDQAEPCNCCCVERILKKMLEKDQTLTEDQRYEIKIYLYEKALEKEIETKEMNNGGSCPCSNLAKADKKTVKDKLNEFIIDAILWQKPIQVN